MESARCSSGRMARSNCCPAPAVALRSSIRSWRRFRRRSLAPAPFSMAKLLRSMSAGVPALACCSRALGPRQKQWASSATSRYESRRSGEWLKIKVTARQEFVICGYTHGDREYFGALVLGVYEKKKLHWVGNVGSGFDQQLLRDIHRRLQPLTTKTLPLS